MNFEIPITVISWILLACVVANASAATRIKDITAIRGVRQNQLIGYGLVVGLQGTGDSLRNSPFTKQSLQSMLDNMGVNVRNGSPRTRNIAAVIITAELPAYSGKGARIDVTVSSLGDASSLAGGTLLMTPLSGADRLIYAVAQGPLAVSGFASSGQAESLTQGVPTTGRIPNGALLERDSPGSFTAMQTITLELRNPDYSTAIQIVDTINRFSRGAYGMTVAQEVDFRSVVLIRPPKVSVARFVSRIGELAVQPDTPARIVIDERSGTIVIGRDVQISTVAVTHGSLTVRVTELPTVSQPAPFANGETTLVPQSVVETGQTGGQLEVDFLRDRHPKRCPA